MILKTAFGMVVLVLLFTMKCQALHCYVCLNCVRFDPSQSQKCPPSESSNCMKMITITDQVQRRCATDEMCANSEKVLKMTFKSVHCCNGDNCNIGHALSPVSTIAAITSLSLLLATVF